MDTERDPDFQRWAAEVRSGMIPNLARSAVSVALISEESVTDLDVRHALEIGAILLMDKPLVLAVTPGVKIPARLARAADRIIEFSEDDPVAFHAALTAIVDELETAGEAPPAA